MVVHASSHLKSEPHGTPTQLCGQCLSFAPLQNMVGGGATLVHAVAVVHERAVDSDVVAVAPQAPFTAFRSRAPPISC
jgi:hypothetical protein